MKVRSIRKKPFSASGCTKGFWKHSRSAGFTRRIFPSYPSGHWLFGFASKKYHPLDDLDKVGWKLKGIHTKYYEPRLHAGVFALPAYVEALLEDVER